MLYNVYDIHIIVSSENILYIFEITFIFRSFVYSFQSIDKKQQQNTIPQTSMT